MRRRFYIGTERSFTPEGYVYKPNRIDHSFRQMCYNTPYGDQLLKIIEEYEKLPKQPKRRAPWESLWPPYEFETTPEQTLSMAWTNWPLFTVGLVQRGYSEEEIQKIIGGNVLRVARAVLS